MGDEEKLLVAIINNKADFAIAKRQNWYRIPVQSARKWAKKAWPPAWLAFYQTKTFENQAFSVNYFARVLHIRKAGRKELFPEEKKNAKSHKRYYQIFFAPLEKLSRPIVSLRRRRITFIPTNRQKFELAQEINDLYDESPLEDRLWTTFKKFGIQAERQEFIAVDKRRYALDFAIYCAGGKIDVEVDGDTWHANPESAARDNLRDNDLKTVGWRVLRFNTSQVLEKMEDYCLPTISENINRLNGIRKSRFASEKIVLDPKKPTQLQMFE